jgi:hypothetical protein
MPISLRMHFAERARLVAAIVTGFNLSSSESMMLRASRKLEMLEDSTCGLRLGWNRLSERFSRWRGLGILYSGSSPKRDFGNVSMARFLRAFSSRAPRYLAAAVPSLIRAARNVPRSFVTFACRQG